MISVDVSKKEEKTSLDQSRIESIVDRTGEIKLLDDAKGAESKGRFF